VYESTHTLYQSLAQQLAVKRFNTKKGAQAAAAVAMAEVSSTATMMTKRITQVAKAASALRKFRFRDAAEALDLVKDKRPRKPRLKGTKLRWTKSPIDGKYFPSRHVTSKERRGAHAFSSTWLEWSFGWAPLVQDISTAAEVLSEPLAYETLVKGSGKYTLAYERLNVVPGSVYDTTYSNKVETRHACRLQAILTVKNPNRDLARRMGLADLTGAALELVPFSFVANWFINLNEFASQFTSFYGVDVKNPFYTDYVISSNVQVTKTTGKVVGYSNTTTPGACFVAYSVRRTVGSLPTISLGLRPAYHLSFQRAITQSALLVTLFTGKRARTL
jgi:virulence-associated protein VapD